MPTYETARSSIDNSAQPGPQLLALVFDPKIALGVVAYEQVARLNLRVVHFDVRHVAMLPGIAAVSQQAGQREVIVGLQPVADRRIARRPGPSLLFGAAAGHFVAGLDGQLGLAVKLLVEIFDSLGIAGVRALAVALILDAAPINKTLDTANLPVNARRVVGSVPQLQ